MNWAIQSSPKDLHLSNPKMVSKPSETMVFEGLFFIEKSNKKDHICTALKKAKMDKFVQLLDKLVVLFAYSIKKAESIYISMF